MSSDSGPDVYLTLPQAFAPLPASIPNVLPPPVEERTLRAPFGINTDLYNFALRPEIPFTFATLYILTVLWLNAYNRSRDNKPWRVSKQTWFRYFVVVHNVLLSLYSFATFIAMFHAIKETLPAWNAQNWRAETADVLCKMHGPRGLGDAATYNTTINIWESKSPFIHLGSDSNPDPTDVGRLWNEGLAFWGWLFYVSKFYEVLDTLIMVAKGKRSATLQTYHHAGAMLCMWAGIRYMSPPIWMFVFINSAIHAMMYTYFTLSALGYKVPQSLKRILTSMQIAQFIFGASYAALHLFIQYDIPLQIPYHVTSIIEDAASSASSAAYAATDSATSAVSSVSSFAEGFAASPISVISSIVESPMATGTMRAFIKKMLLRAAGEEGVAERVGMGQSYRDAIQNPVGAARGEIPNIAERVEKFVERRYETHYRTEWTRINCIDTSGEAFAIYLNLLYLAPLTFLFARFFVRAYAQRGGGGKPRTASEVAHRASQSARDAKNQTERQFEKSGEKAEDEVRKRGSQAQDELSKRGSDGKELLSQRGAEAKDELSKRGSEAKDEAGKRLDELRQDIKAMREGNFSPSPGSNARKVTERVQSYEQKVKRYVSGSGDEKARTGSPTKGGSVDEEEDDRDVRKASSASSGSRQGSSAGAGKGDTAGTGSEEQQQSSSADNKEANTNDSKSREQASASNTESKESDSESQEQASADNEQADMASSGAPEPGSAEAKKLNTPEPDSQQTDNAANKADKTDSKPQQQTPSKGKKRSGKSASKESKSDAVNTKDDQDDTDAMGRSGYPVEPSSSPDAQFISSAPEPQFSPPPGISS
ncbi:hypothetical protein LTR37_000430 [Vermiconidia calcicola]|uniref:Uncharacterized protein n=1 Tax=Vermiconidia calcicola TaxID=1690605 RepID=A0ACC3NYU3_9PEZI|nr:hypothetical protein LTR37_000430 [Vermiconidia calcicola]